MESDATEDHPRPDAAVPVVRLVQVTPASADVQMSPPSYDTATRLEPLESDATPDHSCVDPAAPVVLFVQVTPALDDVQMLPLQAAATRLKPVESDARLCQS